MALFGCVFYFLFEFGVSFLQAFIITFLLILYGVEHPSVSRGG